MTQLRYDPTPGPCVAFTLRADDGAETQHRLPDVLGLVPKSLVHLAMSHPWTWCSEKEGA